MPRTITNKKSLREAAKTSSRRIHIVPTKEGWSIKKEGFKRSSAVFETKTKAIDGASQLSTFDGSIIIHKKDGSIDRRIKR